MSGTEWAPGVRAWLRAEHEVQLGVGPAAVVIGGLQPAETAALVGAGRLTAQQWSRLSATADPRRWQRVREVLSREATSMAPRPVRTGQVRVTGRGSLTDAITAVLGSVADRVARDEEAHLVADVGLAVLPHLDAVAPQHYLPWSRAGIPHLPVVVTPSQVCIGPLVRPGRPGPCLGCLDRYRGDHDPRWADVVTQVGADQYAPVDAPPDLSAVAAGLVGLAARSLFAGGAAAPGVSLLVEAGVPRIRAQLWHRHPGCDCAPGALRRTAQPSG